MNVTVTSHEILNVTTDEEYDSDLNEILGQEDGYLVLPDFDRHPRHHRAGVCALYPSALDGVPGGHEPDPYLLGNLGAHGYTFANHETEESKAARKSYLAKAWDDDESAGWPFLTPPNTEYNPSERLQTTLLTHQHYLQALAGHLDPASGKPVFIDLMNFDPTGGFLGPDACKRLYAAYAARPLLGNTVFEHPLQPLHEGFSTLFAHAARHESGCVSFDTP